MDIQRQRNPISGIKLLESRFIEHGPFSNGRWSWTTSIAPDGVTEISRTSTSFTVHRTNTSVEVFYPNSHLGWADSIRLSDDGASVFFATFEFEDGDITDNHWYFVNLSNGEMSSLDVPSGHLHTWPSLSRTGDVLAFASNQGLDFSMQTETTTESQIFDLCPVNMDHRDVR